MNNGLKPVLGTKFCIISRYTFEGTVNGRNNENKPMEKMHGRGSPHEQSIKAHPNAFEILQYH